MINTFMRWFLMVFYGIGTENSLPFLSANPTRYQEVPTGFGQVANNMMEPVTILSGFVQSGCYVIGGSFVFASVIKYFEHRRSPLMIPISTVVFLLITGIILILLPLVSHLTGAGSVQ